MTEIIRASGTQVRKGLWPPTLVHTSISTGPMFINEYKARGFVKSLKGPAYDEAVKLVQAAMLSPKSCVRVHPA
eukprot:8521633-Pyramimonas_sp.AAC.2